MTRKVITNYVHPPIPIRTHDWCAYFDDEGAEAGRYGWGETEDKAIQDLKDHYDSDEIPCDECIKLQGYNYCTMNCSPRSVKRQTLW